MNEQQTKQSIHDSLTQFGNGSLLQNGLQLFGTIGYRSDKHIPIEPNTANGFLAMFDGQRTFNRDAALLGQWLSIDLLFQLADDDVRRDGQLGLQFDSSGTIDNARMESYLLFALELKARAYTRTELATITREVNKLYLMPVMVLFKHGKALTLAVINRRLHKRDSGKDVLEKVTLIKDISSVEPHRAHIEILYDLSFNELYRVHQFGNFVELHRAWQATLDSSELNKRFYREIADWYFWAMKQVAFPEGAGAEEEVRNATSLIRLLTRLIFVWFLKERSLVPDALFNDDRVKELLLDTDAGSSSYYKAILQNLFFGTLNTDPVETPRKFRGKSAAGGRDSNYMVHNVYRYEALLRDPDAVLKLLREYRF